MSTLAQRKKSVSTPATKGGGDGDKDVKKKDKGKKGKLAKLDDDDDEEEESANVGLNYGEDDEFYKKWCGPMLLGPFLPAIFAMFVILAGQLVLNNWTGSCGYDLECKSFLSLSHRSSSFENHLTNLCFNMMIFIAFISAEISVCYLFLLVFSWVYLGDHIDLEIKALDLKVNVLAPFKSMKWIMYAYALLAFMSFIIGIYGAFIMSLAVFCKTTAVMLYQFSMFLLITYWLGLFITIFYIVKLSYGNNIMALVKERIREETMEEVEERMFRRQFDAFDFEREDKIKREDANKLLQALGVFVPDQEVEQLVNSFDPSKSGFIEFQPMFEWFRELNKQADAKAGKVGDISDSDED